MFKGAMHVMLWAIVWQVVYVVNECTTPHLVRPSTLQQLVTVKPVWQSATVEDAVAVDNG